MADIKTHPWDYPGHPTTKAGLVTKDFFLPFRSLDGCMGKSEVVVDKRVGPRELDSVLTELGRATCSERFAVLMLGATADPRHLRSHLMKHEVSKLVPMFQGTVKDIAVGFGAFPHRYGFIPAVPYHSPGSTAHVVVAMLDKWQFRALVNAKPDDSPKMVAGGLDLHGIWTPEPFYVFKAKHGVLTPPRSTPIPFGTQEEALAAFPLELRHYLAEQTGITLAQAAVPRMVAPYLRDDPVLRFEFRLLLSELGWSDRSGLGQLPEWRGPWTLTPRISGIGHD